MKWKPTLGPVLKKYGSVMGWGKNPTGLSVTFGTTEKYKIEILFHGKIRILSHGKKEASAQVNKKIKCCEYNPWSFVVRVYSPNYLGITDEN